MAETERPVLQVRVDRDVCYGHGVCSGAAPEVYELDEAGYNASDGRLITVEQETRARRGASACPERAIELLPVKNEDESTI